jgi:tetratricopeptide (TPR) repeat protein
MSHKQLKGSPYGRIDRRRWVTGLLALLPMALLVGAAACTRDPAVKKQHYMDRGDSYFKDKHYGEAVIEYKNALRFDPSSGEGYYKLGLALLQKGEWSQATEWLSRSLLFSPDNIDARLRLGDMLLAAGQFEDAHNQAMEVLQRDPQNASVHLLLGQIQLQQKKFKNAEEEFNEAVQRAPQDAVPYGDLALAQLLSGNPEAAEKSFLKAAELEPKDPQYTLNLANYYRSRHQPERAEQVLRQSMTENPGAIELPLGVADLYIYLGRTADAKRLLDQTENDSHHFPDGVRKVADFYSVHSDPAPALDRYLLLAKKNSADESLIESISECYLQLGRWADANTWIDKHDKKDMAPAFELLRARAETGEYHLHDAVAELQSLIQSDPGNTGAHYYLAQADLQQGDVEGAKAALVEALRVQPGYISALLGMGNISLQQNDATGALHFSDEIINRSYWIADAHLMAGNAYILRNNASAALNEFQIAAGLNPSSAAAQERIGRVLSAQGKYGEAEKCYENALNSDPGYALALGGLAENFLAQGQPDRARARIDQQMARQPGLYQLHLIKGQFCMTRGDWDCSVQSYEKALELDSYDATAYMAIAHIYASTNRTDDAAKEYELARQKFPEYLPTYILLGQLHESRGDYDQAKQAYQEALAVNRSYAVALNHLAWLYCEHGGSLNEAFELAQQAKKEAPNDPHISDTLAWIYYKQGHYPSAIHLLESAVAQDPKDPGYQFHLGMAYLTQGQQEQGRKTLQAALRAGLTSEDAKTAKEALQKSGS